MYGLKQAAILAYKQLVNNLQKFGYAQAEGTTGLWSHKTKPTKFALCVDDFGVKYFSQDDAKHLIDALKKHYITSQDWTRKNYCGFKINWNYEKNYVDISIPKYIQNALTRYKHKIKRKIVTGSPKRTNHTSPV